MLWLWEVDEFPAARRNADRAAILGSEEVVVFDRLSTDAPDRCVVQPAFPIL